MAITYHSGYLPVLWYVNLCYLRAQLNLIFRIGKKRDKIKQLYSIWLAPFHSSLKLSLDEVESGDKLYMLGALFLSISFFFIFYFFLIQFYVPFKIISAHMRWGNQ